MQDAGNEIMCEGRRDRENEGVGGHPHRKPISIGNGILGPTGVSRHKLVPRLPCCHYITIIFISYYLLSVLLLELSLLLIVIFVVRVDHHHYYYCYHSYDNYYHC